MQNHDHYHSLRERVTSVKKHSHICMIYSDREQQITALSQYLKTGFKQHEQCLYIGGAEHVQFLMNVLTRAEVDIATEQESKSLLFSCPEDIYFIDGKFLCESVVRQAEQMTAEALANGFSSVRAAAEMTWALHHNVSARQMLEYETEVNATLERLPLTGLCLYNENRFNPRVLRLLIETHPAIVYGGEVIENPDYIAPAQFLAKLDASSDLQLAAS